MARVGDSLLEELSDNVVDVVEELSKLFVRLDIGGDELQNGLTQNALIEKYRGTVNPHELIIDCNGLLVEIENEIAKIHNFIRDEYRLKFPELESLVPYPVDYARVVKKIGNRMDVTVLDLEGCLPAPVMCAVSVTASTTRGKPLPEDALHNTLEACDRVLALDSAKTKVLAFPESRIRSITPNLSAVVGAAVAAKLLVTAGGLSSLAELPCRDIKLLGSKKKILLSQSSRVRPVGGGAYIEQSEIFQTSPPDFRYQTYVLLAQQSALAARMDSTRGDPTGQYGTSLREEILKKIHIWQNPLPVPATDSEPCEEIIRPGRPLRKRKKPVNVKYMRKLVNNMLFGVPAQRESHGMLGKCSGPATY